MAPPGHLISHARCAVAEPWARVVGAPIGGLRATLIGGRRSFAGSMTGGIALTQEMLDFCAERGIGAEVISADRVNDAYERVLSSDVRYRFVIDAATFAS